MPLSVRLPPRVEQKLAEYCVAKKITKSAAIKRALEQLFAQGATASESSHLASRFVGSDKRPGDVARHSKRLLRERFRAK
jgi:hypothetical protein